MPSHRPAAAKSASLGGSAVKTILQRAPSALALAVGLLAALGTSTAKAAFPGAAGLIAFVSDRDGNAEIHVMNPDGSGQTNITNNPASDSSPAFSPDGQRIAFTSSRDGNPEIYVMAADGSDVARLTDNPASDSAPAWSSDGHSIAFVSTRDGNQEIYVMATHGSDITRLTDNPSPDSAPAFSPDGQRIAFQREPPPSPFPGRPVEEIFTMAPDGSDVTRLTNNTADANPNFSPDGQRIAFSRNLFRHHKIHTMAADGSDQNAITNNIEGPCRDFVDDFDPAFSPDGERIAFASNRQGNECFSRNFEIYTVAPDGSGVVRLTDNAASDLDPDWQPLPPPLVLPPGNGEGEPPVGVPSTTWFVHRIVRLRRDCQRNRLRVSGDGVEVAFARRLPRGDCRLTLRVSTGSSGRRDLLIRRGKRTIRLIGVIRL